MTFKQFMLGPWWPHSWIFHGILKLVSLFDGKPHGVTSIDSLLGTASNVEYDNENEDGDDEDEDEYTNDEYSRFEQIITEEELIDNDLLKPEKETEEKEEVKEEEKEKNEEELDLKEQRKESGKDLSETVKQINTYKKAIRTLFDTMMRSTEGNEGYQKAAFRIVDFYDKQLQDIIDNKRDIKEFEKAGKQIEGLKKCRPAYLKSVCDDMLHKEPSSDIMEGHALGGFTDLAQHNYKGYEDHKVEYKYDFDTYKAKLQPAPGGMSKN